jgi:CelD/BcsL family acetyltransferase involved in cellulose biosynthesis
MLTDAPHPGESASQARPVCERPTLTVCRELDALPGFKRAWTALCARAGDALQNADFEHYVAVLAASQGGLRPYAAIWEDATGPRAGFLGRRADRRQKLKVAYLNVRGLRLRALDLVQGGVLCASDADARAVCDHLRELLRTELDQLVVHHMPLDHPFYRALIADRGLSRGLGSTIRDPHWVFELEPGPFEQTLRRFSKKRRYNLAREGRLLAEQFDGDLAVRVITEASELDTLFAWSGAIIERTYHAKVGTRFMDAPLWRTLMELEARRGCLRAHFLLGKGRPIAFNLGIVRGPVLVVETMAHLPDYDRFSPGKHLLIRVFERCAQESLRLVDYCTGDAEYKRVFGTRTWDEVAVSVFGRGPRGRLAQACQWAADGLNALARKLTGSSSRARRLKRAVRRWLTPRSTGGSAGCSETESPERN